MNNTCKITFQNRDGKSNANQIRRDGEIPGILYGKDNKNILLRIQEKQLVQEMSSHGWHNLKDIEVGGKEYSAIIKEIQTDPVTHKIIHIDLESIKPTEMVTTELPIRFVQNKNANKAGEVLEKKKSTVKVKCTAENVPEFLNVTINPQTNAVYRIADIEASEEITVIDSPKTVLASMRWTKSVESQEDDHKEDIDK